MQFLNQSLGFFNKGHFEPIDRNFIAESYQALKPNQNDFSRGRLE
ncbi:hypothetical protein HpMS118_01440 [Helicobacter pylori]